MGNAPSFVVDAQLPYYIIIKHNNVCIYVLGRSGYSKMNACYKNQVDL